MNLYLKNPKHLNGEYFVVENDMFAITDRMPWIGGLCEEYDIILKIKENKDGFFDFNKSLIDIGAEDGNYAMLLDFNKNYCFEPNKKMCSLIYTNMYLKDKIDNTEVFNVALGEKDNEKVVFNGFAEEGSGFYKESMGRYEQPIEIVKKTLDSFNIKDVGLIKTDTEGFDYFVLIGGIHTIIENNYPPILFECWDVGHFNQTQEMHDRIMNFLKSLGYTIFEHWGDGETHLAVKL